MSVVVAALCLPAVAAAGTGDSVVLFSDPGDYVGAGSPALYSPANGPITVTGNAASLEIGASGGASGGGFELDFAAPPGETLAPGIYDNAQRAPFREPGHPGINIIGNGRGCNSDTGRFEVRDIATSPGGGIERLWIVFEQHCEGGPAALFGEVKIGESLPSETTVAYPDTVRWPDLDAGAHGTAVPVTLIASGPAHPSAATIDGADAAAFAIRLDDCAGKALAAGDACQVWVRFNPATAGTHAATLHLGDGEDVALQGFAYGGVTAVTMHSDPGDFIGGGLDYAYTPADSTLFATGTRQLMEYDVNDFEWTADFAPAPGDILAPGTYDGVASWPGNGPAPGLMVTGHARGCNDVTGSFTITSATFDAGGSLRGFGATLVQHCEGAAPALHATFDYRAGDTTPPAPWTLPPGVGYAPPSGPPAPAPSPSPPAKPAPHTAPPRFTSPRACGRRVFAAARHFAGGPRADRIGGSAHSDLIVGGPGSDRLAGGRGNDCIEGQAGADRLDAGPGADVLIGGSGNDRLIGGPGRDVLLCGPGHDIAYVARGDRTRGCEHTRHRRG